MKNLSQPIGKGFVPGRRLQDESGAVLVLALLVLVVLAMLGVVASNMSITELQSSANERRFNQTFYVADSAWQEVVPKLDLRVELPPSDITTFIVDLPDDTPNVLGGIPYQNVVTEISRVTAAGFGDDYAAFKYQVDSTAGPDNNQGVRVIIDKVFFVGY